MNAGRLPLILAVMVVCASICWQAALPSRILAEETDKRYEVGFITGSGRGPVVEGHYSPLLLTAHLGYNIKTAPHKKGRSGLFSIFIEPQVNPVYDPRPEYEAGIGFGIQYLYPLTENLRPYLLMLAGPHYSSFNSKDEAPGFLFQLAAGAGFYYFLNPKTAINLGYRYRHLSNAGLRRPNIGINMHVGVIGLSFFF